ncbi:MAG: prepilin-type N-terminal cleavage/methylation domain-containing protein [Lachnospiraceae bacterium]|nr:prepilin-type N-terminal cleavage/methylation domain-containing protein [Lachnospiraceae bacterium]
MKKLKNDNGGFTLAELLIAIAILAIILTPLTRNFVESTRINAKSRKTMNATNMASNMAEGLSAYSAEEIIIGFDSADDRGNMRIFPDDITCVAHGEAIDNGDGTFGLGYTISGTEVDGAAPSPLYVDGGSVSANALEFIPASNSKYNLYATGVQQEKTTYDVLIKMDASSASTFSGDLDENGTIEGSEVELYNDYSEVRVTTLNRLVDSVYKDSTTIWSDARSKFHDYAPSWGGDISEEDFPKQVSRTIIIDVDELIEATGKKMQINVSNVFKLSTWSHHYSVEQISMPKDTIYESNTQYPRDIYIYYYPNYGDGSGKTVKGDYYDRFVINNNADIDVSVHLIRLLPSGYNEADLADNEASYKTEIVLNDDAANGINTKIYSNLKDDLTKTDEQNLTNRQSATRCPFTLNGIIYSVSSSEYQSIVNNNGGLETITQDRLYSVVIEVYEEGAAAEGFPEDKRVAIYDGASAKQ